MKIDSFKIKLLMAEAEMSQSDLAEKCRITKQNVSLVLTRGTCAIAKVGRIAKALSVDVRDIVVEE